MKSTVETLSPTRVRLEIEVPFAELEPNLKKAYREISAQVNIPGFRRGKVPAAVIDRRVGRGTVLSEAVQDVIPEQFLAAVRAHEVKTIGRPNVEIRELADGQPLRFTAEVDVRPKLTLPELSDIEVEVDAPELTDAEVEEQLGGLRERFATLKTAERPAQEGDYVQIDLAATVDGAEVAGGTATNISHEVGSGQLVPGLDEVLVGMSAGESKTFTTNLVGGEYAGREADVAATVRGVKEKQLPDLDDAFAQMASEFDTLDELRTDLRGRLERVKRLEQLYTARDKALKALVEATDVPAPEGVVTDEVEHRKEAILEQLGRMNASMEEYLASEGKSEEELDAELTASATEAVQVQLVLDALAEARHVTVTDDEFGQEIMQRAQRSESSPQQYYDELLRSGSAGAVYGDVRRSKALALVMEQIRINDANGTRLSLDDLRGPMPDAASPEQDERESPDGGDGDD